MGFRAQSLQPSGSLSLQTCGSRGAGSVVSGSPSLSSSVSWSLQVPSPSVSPEPLSPKQLSPRSQSPSPSVSAPSANGSGVKVGHGVAVAVLVGFRAQSLQPSGSLSVQSCGSRGAGSVASGSPSLSSSSSWSLQVPSPSVSPEASSPTQTSVVSQIPSLSKSGPSSNGSGVNAGHGGAVAALLGFAAQSLQPSGSLSVHTCGSRGAGSVMSGSPSLSSSSSWSLQVPSPSVSPVVSSPVQRSAESQIPSLSSSGPSSSGS